MKRKLIHFSLLGIVICLILGLGYLEERTDMLTSFISEHKESGKEEFQIKNKYQQRGNGVAEVIFPSIWVELSKKSIESYEDVASEINELWDVQSAKLNSDNTIAVFVTKEQWNKEKTKVEIAVNEELKKCENKGVNVSISEDMQEIRYLLTAGCNMSIQSWGMSETIFMGTLLEAQALAGIAPGECKLHEIVENEKTGKIIVDAVSPGEEYTVTEKQ
ncbi:MAG: hypothetical protein RR681_07880 [Lachnospiraceae bacterium]